MRVVLFRSFAVLAATLVTVALGESFVRIYFDGKFGPRPRFYIPNDSLGWMPASGLDHTFFGSDYSIDIKTDQFGHRLGRLGAVDYDAELIVLAGDSFTFGWGVSTGETFASYLEEDVYDSTGGDASVVNLGVGGYGTLQYSTRLANLLESHPAAKIRALIVIHTHNDATDNLKSVGYYTGVHGADEKRHKRKSPVHLVNLIKYSRDRLREMRESSDEQAVPESLNDARTRDVLYSYRGVWRGEFPEELRIGRALYRHDAVAQEDRDIRAVLSRKSLSDIHLSLILEGIESIHRLLEGRQIPIIHTALYQMPEWYFASVESLIGQAATYGNEVIFVGRLPVDDGSFKGRVSSRQTSGHYTGKFNRHWASRMIELLEKRGLLGPADDARVKR